MASLLEKVTRNFNEYLKRLNYGFTEQKYDVLYGAIVYLKLESELENLRYEQYFYNNLPYDSNLSFPTIDEKPNRIISTTINNSYSLASGWTWTEIDAYSENVKTYNLTTNVLAGFNYLYISIPKGVDFIISDPLNFILFDSNIETEQSFTKVGEITTSKNIKNNVYRKNDVYNTINSINLKIIL